MINNADRLASMLDRRDGDLVTMSSALKNRELKTNLVDEDLPMQVGSFGNKKWQPYYFNFTTEVDVNVHNVLDNTPYGKVRFTVNGREWFGRMNDGSVKPGDKDAQQWKLIVAENNDLKKWYEPS